MQLDDSLSQSDHSNKNLTQNLLNVISRKARRSHWLMGVSPFAIAACGGSENNQIRENLIASHVFRDVEYLQLTGLNHATGQIPFDLSGDGKTDLFFAPSNFNRGTNQNAFGIELDGETYNKVEIIFDGENLNTGFVKDWFVNDFNKDGYQDLFFVDHGLELPESEGGFQLGVPRLLLGSPSGVSGSVDLGLELDFYHAAAIGDVTGNGWLDLIIQKFSDPNITIFENNGDTFNKIIPSEDGSVTARLSAWGAVGFLEIDSSAAIVTATYINRKDTNPDGEVNFFTYSNGALEKTFKLTYPEPLAVENLGAFLIVTGDFNGDKQEDVIVFLEKDLGENTMGWLYLENNFGVFEDKTIEAFGGYFPQQRIPSKFLSFDIDRDGDLDLIGFSWDINAYAEDRLWMLNDGDGKFSWAETSKIPEIPTDGLFVPQFHHEGSEFIEMVGLYVYNPSDRRGELQVDLYGFDGVI